MRSSNFVMNSTETNRTGKHNPEHCKKAQKHASAFPETKAVTLRAPQRRVRDGKASCQVYRATTVWTVLRSRARKVSRHGYGTGACSVQQRVRVGGIVGVSETEWA